MESVSVFRGIHKKNIDQIKSDTKLNAKQKKNRMKKLTVNKKWITNISYWWGRDDVTVNEFTYNNFIDLAAGKIESFAGKEIPNYPIFKNFKNKLLPGTSLCRQGFPFHNINASFDEKSNSFNIDPNMLPAPRFPIEGIHTRIVMIIDNKKNKHAKFIETSSPGLRGQSGGPLFDRDAKVWGLQSRTTHLPLGFAPKVNYKNKVVEEHQFISVGQATHVEEISNFLTENNIEFAIESE